MNNSILFIVIVLSIYNTIIILKDEYKQNSFWSKSIGVQLFNIFCRKAGHQCCNFKNQWIPRFLLPNIVQKEIHQLSKMIIWPDLAGLGRKSGLKIPLGGYAFEYFLEISTPINVVSYGR